MPDSWPCPLWGGRDLGAVKDGTKAMSIQALLSEFGDQYFSALLTTYQLTALAFLCAAAIGIVVTVMRISPIKPLRAAADFYVQVFRNIPGMALLVFLVYALPYLDIMMSYFACVMVTITVIPSAFFSEYLMAGLNTISPGQIEAARSLGMSFFQVVKNVVLPQALRSSVLQITNLLVATMLTSALGAQVPLVPTELTGIVKYINSRTVGGVTAFFISAALYCATAVVIGQIGNWIDKKVRILR